MKRKERVYYEILAGWYKGELCEVIYESPNRNAPICNCVLTNSKEKVNVMRYHLRQVGESVNEIKGEGIDYVTLTVIGVCT